MQLRNILCVISILLTGACGQTKRETLPADILPPDSMAAIMCRVHLTESAILQRQLGQDSLTKEIAWASYRKLFAESGIDYQEFAKSFEYYRNRPEEFQKIYDLVLVRLGDEQATLSGR